MKTKMKSLTIIIIIVIIKYFCLFIVISVKDVNECEVNDPCISPAKCRNTVGSYACDCPTGYEKKSKNECQGITI